MTDLSWRLGIFCAVFCCVALAEVVWPRRQRVLGRWVRWPHNIAIALLNGVLSRVVLPATLAGLAVWAQQRGWGLLTHSGLPFWLVVGISLVALDGLIYAQHVMFHKVPLLWRLHRVHHADTEFDTTTALRFHPVEIILSLGIKAAAVVALGVPAEAIFLFEIILNACALFNHGNFYLPLGLDRLLRWAVVTPDMHRIHHSPHPAETNSNYGFNLAVWDRVFKTYTAHPQEEQATMTLGLETFRAVSECRLDCLLTQPFRSEAPAAAPGKDIS